MFCIRQKAPQMILTHATHITYHASFLAYNFWIHMIFQKAILEKADTEKNAPKIDLWCIHFVTDFLPETKV